MTQKRQRLQQLVELCPTEQAQLFELSRNAITRFEHPCPSTYYFDETFGGVGLETSRDSMLFISPTTASAMSPHASGTSWVMFVQSMLPGDKLGPILIEGVRGIDIAPRLHEISRSNAFETMLIGLVDTKTPTDSARAIGAQYSSKHLHDDWYEPTVDLLAYIQHVAQAPIKALLAQTHPGGFSEAPVDIEAMARILGVSSKTIRRMVHASEIPFTRHGQTYYFVPAEVIAAYQRRGR